MARRTGLTDEDVTVIAEALGAQINESIIRAANDSTERGEAMTALTPLFRVREKVLAMRKTGNGAAKPAAKPTRKRAEQPNPRDVAALGGDPSL